MIEVKPPLGGLISWCVAMKIFIVDESKGNRYFIYGGCIIDYSHFYNLKNKINKDIEEAISKKTPNNFEVKANLSDLNQQMNYYDDYLFDDNGSTTLINYGDTYNTANGNMRNYFNSNNLIEMHKIVLNIAYNYNVKYIVFIFPSITSLNNENEKFNQYETAIKYCKDEFNKFLKSDNSRGIMLVDEMGGDVGKRGNVNTKILNCIMGSSFSNDFGNIDLFLPQIIVRDIFSIPNVFLNWIKRFFENEKVYDYLNKIKNQIYRIDVYPNSFKDDYNKDKLDKLKN